MKRLMCRETPFTSDTEHYWFWTYLKRVWQTPDEENKLLKKGKPDTIKDFGESKNILPTTYLEINLKLK